MDIHNEIQSQSVRNFAIGLNETTLACPQARADWQRIASDRKNNFAEAHLPPVRIEDRNDNPRHHACEVLADGVHKRWGKNVSLNIDNPIEGASILFLGPGLYDAIGHETAQAMMRESLVFGFGVSNGIAKEAMKQERSQLIERAAVNSELGFGMGALSEVNPTSATTVGLAAVAMWVKSEFGPDKAQRNSEIESLARQVWLDKNNTNLKGATARADSLLGKDSFNTIFDVASGSLSFPIGSGVASELPSKQIGGELLIELTGGVKTAISDFTRQISELVQRDLPLPTIGCAPNVNIALSKASEGFSSSSKSLAGRIARLTDADLKDVEVKLEQAKSEDPSGNKLMQIGAIMHAFETATNLRPSMAVLFSNLMDVDKLNAYRRALELPSAIHGLADLPASQIKSLSRSLESKLGDLEEAVKSGSSEKVHARVQSLKNFTDVMQIAKASSEQARVLPKGIWTYSLEQVKSEFVYNPKREELFKGILKLARELKAAGCQNLYLNGSFCTGKPIPKDFDATWEPQGVDMSKLSPELRGAWRTTPERIAKYGGDIFIRDPKVTGHDHVEQWQKDLRTGIKKGVILIDLRSETF